ncbi:MAG: hypothetical protein J07AB43_16440 [Candidatus Nanosalina sp. J07AB43]|nr:MAG: hypothetical protein J07AB43_16440 [Candidatus Nanosalina sp. J07AB43]
MRSDLFRAFTLTSLISSFSVLGLLLIHKESAAPLSVLLAIVGFLAVHGARRKSVLMKNLSRRKTVLSIVEDIFEISILVGLSLGRLLPKLEALTALSMLLALKVLEGNASKTVNFDGLELTGTEARTSVLMIALGASAFLSSFTFYIGMVYISLTSYRVLAILYRFIEELMQVKLKNRIFSN